MSTFIGWKEEHGPGIGQNIKGIKDPACQESPPLPSGPCIKEAKILWRWGGVGKREKSREENKKIRSQTEGDGRIRMVETLHLHLEI